MSFPWLDSAPRIDGSARHATVATEELSHRAALFYRLGYSEADATARLTARIAWEYDKRPTGLSDEAIAKLVHETYARRPGS